MKYLSGFGQFIGESSDRFAKLGLVTELDRLKLQAADLVKALGGEPVYITDDMLDLFGNSEFDWDDLRDWFGVEFDEQCLGNGDPVEAIRLLDQGDYIGDVEDEEEWAEACEAQMEMNWGGIRLEFVLEIGESGNIRTFGEYFDISGSNADFNNLMPKDGFELTRIATDQSDLETIYADVILVMTKLLAKRQEVQDDSE